MPLKRAFAYFAAGVALLMLSRSGTAQSFYHHTVIDVLPTSSQPPSINNHGTMAYIISNGEAVRSDGETRTTLWVYTGGPGAGGHASINDAGVVVFRAGGGAFFDRIMIAQPGMPTGEAVVANPTWDVANEPWINNAGQIVFRAVLNATNGSHIVTGGTFTPLAGPGDAYPGGTIGNAFGPNVNNAGQVGFTANVGPGLTDIFRLSAGILTRMGRASGPGQTFGMNDAGVVAFYSSGAIVTSDGVVQTTIVASGAGFSVQPHRVSINNAGEVAFLATSGSGPARVVVGDGGSLRTVLQPGDQIPNLGTVVTTLIGTDAINDAGQVATVVTYHDGEDGNNYAIVRSDPINRAPVAAASAARTDEDTPVSGLLNASDPDRDPISFTIVGQAQSGVATLTDPATGAFTYTPNANVFGTDTFTFRANDGEADSNVETVTVTIDPVNDPPAAAGGGFTAIVDTQYVGLLPGSDVDHDPLTFSIVTNGSRGTAVITNPATGAFTYTPLPGATGPDSFMYRVSDGGPISSSAPMLVTIEQPRRDQTISFGPLQDQLFRRTSIILYATASSGLPVTFAADGPCAIVGTGVELRGAGICSITASQAGNADYWPAPDVVRSFTIHKAHQDIVFDPLPDQPETVDQVYPAATATSGLPVSFSTTGDCSLVLINVVVLRGPGFCSVTASQHGNDDYNAAPPVTHTFQILDTRPPSLEIVSPGPEDFVINSPVAVRVRASDSRFITSVMINGGAATQVSGTWFSGEWVAPIAVSLPMVDGSALRFVATATDQAGHTTSVERIVDNDGIEASLDYRFLDHPPGGLPQYLDLRHAYSHDFNDFTTENGPVVRAQTGGAIVSRGGWALAISDQPNSGVRARVTGQGTVATLATCPGHEAEFIDFDGPNETASIRCLDDWHRDLYFGTSRIQADQAVGAGGSPNHLIVRKHYHLGSLLDYWVRLGLPTNHAVAIGSPVTADPSNVEPIRVELVDDSGMVLAWFELDPGESVDLSDDVDVENSIGVEVLIGAIDFAIGGAILPMSAGEPIRVISLGPLATLRGVLAALPNLTDPPPDRLRAETVAALLAEAVAAQRWTDPFRLAADPAHLVFTRIHAAANGLRYLSGPEDGPPAGPAIAELIAGLVRAAREIAVVAIADAIAAGAPETTVGRATAERDRGDEAAVSGRSEVAILHYRTAWMHAFP